MTSDSDASKAADAKRRKEQPWRRWYWSRRWKEKKARQKKAEPLCRSCAARGMSRAATTADHIVPHRGDPLLFWYGELQSLCDTCHSSAKQREEVEGFSRDVGGDGWPVDPRHPFNKPR